MSWRTAIARLLPGLLALSVAACQARRPPSPFPLLGPQSPAEQARVLQARTTGIQTLAAVLTMSLITRAQQQTFDMVVNYDATGQMRFTALKDIGLSTQPLFDLLLRHNHYHLALYDAAEPRQFQGAVTQLLTEHPPFGVFWVLGEALFLPGFDRTGALLVPKSTTACRFTTRLHSGVRTHWWCRAQTLEVIAARVDEPSPLRIQYEEYRQVDTYYIPGHVILRAPRLGFTTHARLKQVDLNMPLVPGIFAMPPMPQGSSCSRNRQARPVTSHHHVLPCGTTPHAQTALRIMGSH